MNSKIKLTTQVFAFIRHRSQTRFEILCKPNLVFPCSCVIVLLCSCAKNDWNYDWAESIQKSDYEIISLGTYPYTTSQIRYEPEEFIELRNKIENLSELLPQIVRHFYPEEQHQISFKYKFGAIDSFGTTNGNKIILRYFAMIPESKAGDKLFELDKSSSYKRFAGYSIQFVFIDKEVREIYLFKTPLE